MDEGSSLSNPFSASASPSSSPVAEKRGIASTPWAKGGPSSWASVLRSDSVNALSAFNLEAEEVLKHLSYSPRGTFSPDPSALKASQEALSKSLIGKFLGRHPPIPSIIRDVHMKWGYGDKIIVTKMAGGFFLFRFDSSLPPDASSMVLAGGPWNLGGKLIKLAHWRPDFRPLEEDIVSAPVWIRMEGLPLEFWSPKLLLPLVSCIGKPLKVDALTATKERTEFARICVEINLQTPLIHKIWIDRGSCSYFQKIQYENLPMVCFRCKSIGHLTKDCPVSVVDSEVHSDNPKAPDGPSVIQNSIAASMVITPTLLEDSIPSDIPYGRETLFTAPIAPVENVEEIGPWIHVQRRRRKPSQLPADGKPRPEHNSFKFNSKGSPSKPQFLKSKSPVSFKSNSSMAKEDRLKLHSGSMNLSNKRRRDLSPFKSSPLVMHTDPSPYHRSSNPIFDKAKAAINRVVSSAGLASEIEETIMAVDHSKDMDILPGKGPLIDPGGVWVLRLPNRQLYG